jgi:type I restriction enzyme S subunit
VFAQKGEGWTEGLLSNVVAIKHGFAFKSEYFVERGNYVLLTPGNFFESGGYRDRGDKQKFYEGEIPNGYVLKKGDLLMAMTEQAAGLLGSSIIVPENDTFLHNQRLGLLAPYAGTPWHNRFFFHQFNTRPFRQAAHDSASGVKVRHTSPAKLGQIHVAYPSKVDDQKQIADELDDLAIETQRLESLYRRKLAALAELKQALLQKAFAGELTDGPEAGDRRREEGAA